jgi:glycine cleavage system P protein (glycine dehydrogenase) subunit 1
MAYVPHTDKQIAEMLKAIGVEKFDDLIKAIPEDVRLKEGLDLSDGLSEYDVTKRMSALGEKNRDAVTSLNFLGGGAYDHFVPSGVGDLLNRSEWYTAYTPYQPEVSQGTLQAIYEFQSVMCNITGMDVSNASVYDSATGATEAMLLGLRAQKKRNKVLVSEGLHPHAIKVMRTYTAASDVEFVTIPIGADGRTDQDALKAALDDNTAVVHFQQPNFFGVLEDAQTLSDIIHENKSLVAVNVYPISLGMVAPPGEYGADIAIGEGQCLGNGLGFGGPYLGIFTATKKLLRQMPGRISGETVDKEGQRGYVLTLQTREQHIRREKATSNICTNQGLNALAAVIYMALIGKEGFKQLSELCYHKAHYLHDKISKETKLKPVYDSPFFNEFVVETPIPAKELRDKLADQGILGGINMERFFDGMENHLMIAVTETRSKDELDKFVEVLKTI